MNTKYLVIPCLFRFPKYIIDIKPINYYVSTQCLEELFINLINNVMYQEKHLMITKFSNNMLIENYDLYYIYLYSSERKY